MTLYSAVLFSPPLTRQSWTFTYSNGEPFLWAVDSSFYYEMIHFAGALEDHGKARLPSLLQRGVCTSLGS
jgi:hypothetical protein